MLRTILGLAGAAVFALHATNATADDARTDEPVRVVVLGRPNASTLARMRAELESLGWQVFAPRPRGDAPGIAPSRAELEDTAREFHARALVEIDDDAALHVWIIDAAGHARPVEVVQTPAQDVSALRSAEVVRAALEYQLSGPAAPAAVENAAEPSAPPSKRRKFAIGGGLSMLAMPYGGLSPGWNLRLDGRYEFTRTLGVAVLLGIPLAPSTWQASKNSTDIRSWFVGGGLVFTWRSKEELWSVRAGPGFALIGQEYSGAGYRSGAHDVTQGGPIYLPFVQLEAGLRIFSNVHWNAGILVGYGLPRTSLKTTDEFPNSAVWGQPLTMPSTTLDVTF